MSWIQVNKFDRWVLSLIGLTSAYGLSMLVLSAPVLADYEHGIGSYKAGNHVAALSDFGDQVIRGHAGSQFMLGVMYFYGKGVNRHDGIAAVWFHKAAIKGHAGAQLAFGSLFLDGVGVEKDLVSAYKWLSLAADSNVSRLREQALALRDMAALDMSPEDIEKAKRYAREWSPKSADFVNED